MDFISPQFIILFVFFIILLWFNHRIIRSDTFFVLSLLFTNIFFYIWNEPKDLIFLILFITANFFAGLWLAKISHQSKNRKYLLSTIILLDLIGLGYYKYSNFLAESLIQIGLPQSAFPAFFTAPKMLPLGISFFTFQAMSYCIDIYSNRIQPARFTEFFNFIAFFPKVSSGPIMRPGDFLAQIKNRVNLNWSTFNESVYLIISGVFLKVVCADSAAAVVNKYWPIGLQQESHAFDLIITVIYFSIQVFCDFSGYTNIARGIALLVGFRMPINFIRPYTAPSITQFWQNWHISLTEWIRIYLFYPLERISRNKVWLSITPILVMLIVGLWHGAKETYILWGSIFGIGMSIERITRINRPNTRLWARIGWAFVTQLMVFFGWIFFRSDTINEGFTVVIKIFHGLITPGSLFPTNELLNIAFPNITYWINSTNGSFYNMIFPALIDTLPLLTIVIIHLSPIWEKGLQKDNKVIVVGIGKAILAGIMLFLSLSAYSATPSPYLYFNF